MSHGGNGFAERVRTLLIHGKYRIEDARQEASACAIGVQDCDLGEGRGKRGIGVEDLKVALLGPLVLRQRASIGFFITAGLSLRVGGVLEALEDLGRHPRLAWVGRWPLRAW